MKKNDFSLTANPSVQNGGIIEMSKGANPERPMLGIGLLPGIIGAGGPRLVYEMNRWQAQAILDGATLARWTGTIVGGVAKPKSEISYL